jgi:pleiotropic regulator 1
MIKKFDTFFIRKMQEETIETLPPLQSEVRRSRKRALNLFYSSSRLEPVAIFPDLQRSRVLSKILAEYPSATAVANNTSIPIIDGSSSDSTRQLLHLTNGTTSSSSATSAAPLFRQEEAGQALLIGKKASISFVGNSLSSSSNADSTPAATPVAPLISASSAAVLEVASVLQSRSRPSIANANLVDTESEAAMQRVEEIAKLARSQSRVLMEKARPLQPSPQWHAPWKVMRVISGHQGWVRSIAVEPGNDWFATGAADRTIKIWDLASGTLRLTLTGHINAVRALVVSPRHPYLFSAGEDKLVKCWDLETNKVIREYHGHLSGVYCMEMHPTLDLLVTGGRDSVARVWDMRTKAQTHTLGGHEQTVHSVLTNSTEPQVITGSMDSTIRLWDLVKGKPRVVLTHHKKAVRSMVGHSKEFAFISGASDNLKKWALPDGVFVSNYSGHNTIINSLAINQDNVLVSGGDDGSLKFWDYSTGYSFHESQSRAQPGSLESEAGIYAMAFDKTGLRLITGEADKTIKIYKEDPEATEETHPVDVKGFEAFYSSSLSLFPSTSSHS